ASETVLKGFSSPSPQYHAEPKSSAVPAGFGTHACPSTQPVFSQTSRSTTSKADDRSSAVVNSVVIVWSKLSCSSLSWRFCSALGDRSAFLASLLIIVGNVGFRTIDGILSNFPQPPLERILDFRPMPTSERQWESVVD